jgi:hypothetical protein
MDRGEGHFHRWNASRQYGTRADDGGAGALDA